MVLPSDFLKTTDENAFFTEDSEPFDIHEPGEYRIEVKSGLFTHNCTLILEDTIAPKGNPVRLNLEVGQTCAAADFVSDITDATEVAVSYVTEPDFSKAGAQTVQVVLRDKGNNETLIESELFLSSVAKEITVEAGGTAPSPDDFVLAGENAAFLTAVEELDYTKLGDYEVSLEVDGKAYTSVLHVADTISPKAQVHDVEDYALVPKKAEDFVTAIEDATEVTVSFREEPDLTKTGNQDLVIVFTDAAGNITEKQVTLSLKEDTESPVIKGAADLSVYVGDKIFYKKNITVTDNCPVGITLAVDSNNVNLQNEGVYPVTYTARDLVGNVTTVNVNVTVSVRVYTEEEVYALADGILAQIIKPDMTTREKAKAIFDYVHSHISYTGVSDKSSWIVGAYIGFTQGSGDCFNYFSCSKALLTRAGIPNVDLQRVGGTSLHYWQLVDVGDGYYHFDATPHPVDYPLYSFLLTEAEVRAYTELVSPKKKNYFVYDYASCPVTVVGTPEE